jgi:iron complex transport system ATP-binding protein
VAIAQPPVDPMTIPSELPTAALQADRLSVRYGDRPALRDIHLTAAPGQLTMLLGPNGSGKSTLIRAVLGVLPASGTITWFGRPLHAWKRRELAKRLAYLPQAPVFDPDSRVVDVLGLGRAPYWGAFGLESARDAAVVQDVAHRLALADLLNRPMDSLSGGQQQRALIGRCLAQEPAALLLDEPEAHLDLRHGVELCQLLRQLAAERSMAILLAVHDLNLAVAFADRVMLLNEGSAAAAGTVDVLTADLLSEVYGLPILHRPGDVPGARPVFLPAAYAGGTASAPVLDAGSVGQINRSGTSNSRS